MRRHSRHVLGAIALLFVTFASVTRTAPAGEFAQAPTPAQAPTFRSTVKLIDIDVFVTDEDGGFVKDLTRDDFEITEDGKPQPLETFAFVDLPILPELAEPQPAPVEPDVATNTDPQGRLYAIVMDSPSTQGPPSPVDGLTYAVITKRVATRFIDEFMQPGDLAGVIHAQGTFTDGQSFTSSKERLRASVDRFGLGLSGDLDLLTGSERVRRHLDTYRTLQDVAQRLGAITGRRKAILWIGGQLRFEMPGCPPGTPLTTLACQLTNQWGFIQIAHRDAVSAATRNNVAIYAIDPVGLTTAMGAGELDRRAALQVVAIDTGGLSIVGTNNFSRGFQNIVRDNSTYYVLGYVPSQEYRDGKFHRVDVRVKRPGRFTVRTRKGYMAPAPETRVADAAAPPPGSSEAARAALRQPIPVRGLEVSLFTAPFKGTGRDHSVIIGGRVSGELLLEGKQDISLSYQVFTLENRIQTGEFKVFALNLRPETRTRVATDGLHFIDRLSLPPGRYELRYVVDQPGGAVGSVVAPLLVPKFDEELSLSGVTLASAATAGRFLVRDDSEVRERTGATPTSARAFRPDDVITAYLEVYSGDSRLTAADLTVNAIISTPAGHEIKRVVARDGSQEKRSAVGWPFTVELHLSDVPAGSYVLTVTVEAKRQKDPVQHQIPIRVEE